MLALCVTNALSCITNVNLSCRSRHEHLVVGCNCSRSLFSSLMPFLGIQCKNLNCLENLYPLVNLEKNQNINITLDIVIRIITTLIKLDSVEASFEPVILAFALKPVYHTGLKLARNWLPSHPHN